MLLWFVFFVVRRCHKVNSQTSERPVRYERAYTLQRYLSHLLFLRSVWLLSHALTTFHFSRYVTLPSLDTAAGERATS